MYHSFQLTPSTSTNDPITQPRPQMGQCEQHNYFRSEPFALSSTPPAPQVMPYPAVERQQMTPTPVSQQTQHRVQRLPSIMGSFYKINAEDETTKDGDDQYGFEG